MQGLLDAVQGLLPAPGRVLAGFYVQTPPGGSFTAWLLTPATLTRYETGAGVALTVTLPAARVCRLVERLSAGGLEVLVELDADDAVLRAVDPDGAVSRMSRASYTLLEASASPHIGELHTFAAAVRSVMSG